MHANITWKTIRWNKSTLESHCWCKIQRKPPSLGEGHSKRKSTLQQIFCHSVCCSLLTRNRIWLGAGTSKQNSEMVILDRREVQTNLNVFSQKMEPLFYRETDLLHACRKWRNMQCRNDVKNWRTGRSLVPLWSSVSILRKKQFNGVCTARRTVLISIKSVSHVPLSRQIRDYVRHSATT